MNQGGDYNLDGESNDRPNAIANNVHATHSQWADGFNLPDNFLFGAVFGLRGKPWPEYVCGPRLLGRSILHFSRTSGFLTDFVCSSELKLSTSSTTQTF